MPVKGRIEKTKFKTSLIFSNILSEKKNMYISSLHNLQLHKKYNDEVLFSLNPYSSTVYDFLYSTINIEKKMIPERRSKHIICLQLWKQIYPDSNICQLSSSKKNVTCLLSPKRSYVSIYSDKYTDICSGTQMLIYCYVTMHTITNETMRSYLTIIHKISLCVCHRVTQVGFYLWWTKFFS